MNAHDLTRRTFCRLTGLLGAGAMLVLAGCGRGDKQAAERTEAAVQAAEGTPAAEDCNDLTGLTAAQVQVRETFEYVETTPDADLACHLCEFYTEPEAGRACGGCTLFAGPVSPDGSCNSFSEA